jgi:putative ABC transport system ATP-binding protein
MSWEPAVPTSIRGPSREPLLRVESVSRTFDDGAVQALVDVSFVVEHGEYVAITGPSGSGKSTLLNLLGTLDRPDCGEIYFDGHPVSRRHDVDRFRSEVIGFVFQCFHLLPTLTALENVQIPMFEGSLRRRQRVERARELLATVGLANRMDHVPAKLSVGERQRVAIARALANEPKLLLADEPTGNLDSVSTCGVLDLFDALHQQRGLTLIVITHGTDVAARAERTLGIRDGRIHSSSPAVRRVPKCAS